MPREKGGGETLSSRSLIQGVGFDAHHTAEGSPKRSREKANRESPGRRDVRAAGQRERASDRRETLVTKKRESHGRNLSTVTESTNTFRWSPPIAKP